MRTKNINQQGAVAIILTLLILSAITAIGFGVGALAIQQIEASRQAGKSVIAFYTADAGAEKCLYEVRQNGAGSCPYTDVALDFSADAIYTTTYNGSDTITSIGQFQGASRKIEVTW